MKFGESDFDVSYDLIFMVFSEFIYESDFNVYYMYSFPYLVEKNVHSDAE